MLLQRRLAIGLLLLHLVSCASKPRPEPFYTRLYTGTYDEVWLATLRALSDYPVKISNKESGRIQSEVINGPYNELLFTYPDPIELPERYRYSLKFSFARLASGESSLVRIRLVKELEQFQDFYTGWTPFPSDGLEEKVLLYRVEHLLRMEKHLSRVISN